MAQHDPTPEAHPDTANATSMPLGRNAQLAEFARNARGGPIPRVPAAGTPRPIAGRSRCGLSARQIHPGAGAYADPLPRLARQRHVVDAVALQRADQRRRLEDDTAGARVDDREYP